MSKLTKTIEDFNNAKSNADYDKTLNKMLWDAFFLQSMLADFFNISDGNEVELTLSNNGLRGLAMLMDHCADLTINAIGIVPSGPLQMKVASHE
ncbi:MAG: hypothetical protein PHW09_14225 [Desulfovibrio desulfuricans]|nr:hypothetical protein [Desulfovibrio desulfuricans]